jgi:hypothetical protein
MFGQFHDWVLTCEDAAQGLPVIAPETLPAREDIAQPSLSRQIQALEEESSTKLRAGDAPKTSFCFRYQI